MFIIRAVNVNDAYMKGLELLSTMGQRSASRAGDVVVLPAPLMVSYHNPKQRVLFDAQRDSNPFFSLFEALWMLAGRNDARWLDRFVHDFSTRFAEEGGVQHGAYGFRWRKHFDIDGGGRPGLPDQLETVVNLLTKNPNDRRAVLTMWDPAADLDVPKKDVPCNTHVYLRVRGERGMVDRGNGDVGEYDDRVLDITVLCRSNDFIWGMTGANAVHFSILQEYLAGRIGVGIGNYYQFANNAHYYTGVAEKLLSTGANETVTQYPEQTPMGVHWEVWDEDLRHFMAWCNREIDNLDTTNSWFTQTAAPLMVAHGYWKSKEYDTALSVVRDRAHDISPDWRKACDEWMVRRIKRMSEKGRV